MKKLFLIAFACLFIACNQAKSSKEKSSTSDSRKLEMVNTFKVDNGHNEKVEVNCFLYDELFNKFTYEEAMALLNTASLEAEYSCKHTPTYVPKTFHVMAKHDSISVGVDFEASNAYGTPNKLTGTFTYLKQNGKYVLVDHYVLEL